LRAELHLSGSDASALKVTDLWAEGLAGGRTNHRATLRESVSPDKTGAGGEPLRLGTTPSAVRYEAGI